MIDPERNLFRTIACHVKHKNASNVWWLLRDAEKLCQVHIRR